MAARKKEAEAADTTSNGVTPVGTLKLIEGTGGGIAEKHLFIVPYGAPKVGKTFAAATLEPKRTKWLISDPNSLATLRAIDRLPPKKHIYVVKSLTEARSVLGNFLDVADAADQAGEIPADVFDADALVVDSGTQFSDWHKEDVARETGQRWLGDNQKENGWDRFNHEFGGFVRDLTSLARYIHVVLICHANQKPNIQKGDWAGLSLSPQMSELVARSANWLLFMTARDLTEEHVVKLAGEAGLKGKNPFIAVVEGRGDEKRYTERVINTQPVGGWNASAAGQKVKAEEPPSIRALLEKEGLL